MISALDYIYGQLGLWGILTIVFFVGEIIFLFFRKEFAASLPLSVLLVLLPVLPRLIESALVLKAVKLEKYPADVFLDIDAAIADVEFGIKIGIICGIVIAILIVVKRWWKK